MRPGRNSARGSLWGTFYVVLDTEAEFALKLTWRTAWSLVRAGCSPKPCFQGNYGRYHHGCSSDWFLPQTPAQTLSFQSLLLISLARNKHTLDLGAQDTSVLAQSHRTLRTLKSPRCPLLHPHSQSLTDLQSLAVCCQHRSPSQPFPYHELSCHEDCVALNIPVCS